MERRGEDRSLIDEVITLDNAFRQLLKEAETLRARRNDVSKQISRMKDKPADLIAEMRQVGDRIGQIEAESGEIAGRLEDKLLRLPNLPAEDVPDGKDSGSNIEVDLRPKFGSRCRTGNWGRNWVLSISSAELSSREPGSTY
jgi:seryl-tRNA synthetase